MVDVKVNMIHPEIFKALVYHTLDMRLTADTCFNIRRRSRQKFCCNHNFITLCKIFERPADILLTCSRLVSYCGIVEIDTQFKPSLYDLTGMLLVYRPRMLTAACISESHTAHTDTGHFQV